MKRWRFGTQLAVAAALLALHQLSLSAPAERYQSFHGLAWQESSTCSPESTARRLPGSGPIVRSRPGQTSCATLPLRLPSASLGIEYAGRIPAGARFQLSVLVAGEPVFRVELQRPRRKAWTSRRIALPAALAEREVVLRLEALGNDAPDGRLALRNRVVFHASESALEAQLEPLRSAAGKWLAALLAAASLGWLWAAHAERFSRAGPYLAFLLLAALGVQLRTAPFFAWDEWLTLYRFSARGLHAVLETHNEHLLPLFFSVYFTEASLFGDRYVLYLVASLLGHVLNAFLLSRLLARMAVGLPRGADAARLLGFLFLVMAAHAEVLQWGFEICVVSSQSCVLLSLYAAWDYTERGSRASLALAAAGAAAAPLYFGNGFSAAAQIAAVAALAAALSGRPVRALAPRLLALAAATAAGVAIPALLYLRAGKSAAGWLSTAVADLPSHPLAIASYAISGSQVGTVLRALGWIGPLGRSEAGGRFPDWIPGLPPEISAPLLGTALSLCLLGLGLGLNPRGRRRTALLWWACGQAILLASYLLPAVGRWKLSVLQSLALRYSYGALAGLLLCSLLPLLGMLSAGPSEGAVLRRRVALFLCLFAFLAAQLHRGATFDELSALGRSSRSFAAELREWNALLAAQAGVAAVAYDGRGTPLHGLQPLPPRGMAPGVGPDAIAAALHWLDPLAWPLRSAGPRSQARILNSAAAARSAERTAPSQEGSVR
jgi:hypothetical protein